MKENEKKLSLILATLFLLVVVIQVIPLLRTYYLDGQENIALLQDRLERYQQLIEDTEQWQEREALKRIESADYEHWVFEGSDSRLLATSVQRSLRQAVDQSGIAVREMSVARYSYVGDWLMVTQDMNVILEQEKILPFLSALNALTPKIFVTAFSVTRSRRQFTGTISVVGFGKTANAPANTLITESQL